MMLNIHSIETFGTHEGPGIRLVVFMQGCRFRCLYCHNPDTWALNTGINTTYEEILALLEKQKSYFKKDGGLTVSGGEPLIQRQVLTQLFTLAKAQGFHTALDTNGSILDADSKTLLKYTDLVLLDVKHIDPQLHFKLTRANNKITLRFAEYCEAQNIKMWLRYVLVPGYSDQERYLHAYGSYFKDYKSIERVEILPYHTFGAYKYKELGLEYKLRGVPTPSLSSIQMAREILQQYFLQVHVR